MRTDAILFMIHCEEGTGYAISSLESAFFLAAETAGYTPDTIHFSYSKIKPNKDKLSPDRLKESNRIECNYNENSAQAQRAVFDYILKNSIKTVFAFDMQVQNKICRGLRKSGVKKIISYWGAPISSLNHGLRLFAKKLETRTYIYQPDIYIFESKAMLETAVKGRGIPEKRTRLVYLGVDTDRFNRNAYDRNYARNTFSIPQDRTILFYSGHMEPRKGVEVILRSLNVLINEQYNTGLHLLLCGDTIEDKIRLENICKGTKAENHITFCGYRNDIPPLMASSDIGVIASTGWDSFTMSSIEMAASGLPLLVSNLQGLKETVEDARTGYVFPPGDSISLAKLINNLSVDESKRIALGKAARERAERNFSREIQIEHLAKIISEV